MTDLPPTTRDRLADHIKQSAVSAIVDPGKEPTSRMVILGHLLNPAANVVDSAITRWERGSRFPTIDRERIADYITRQLERSVLGLSNSPMDLEQLVKASSPFAWSDRFAAACVQSGITEVRRARTREVPADLHTEEAIPLAAVASVDWSERTLSAEELFLIRERHGLISSLTEVVETWGERGLSATERAAERARAARTLLGVPAAAVADDDHKRWLGVFLKTDGAEHALRLSLAAHRDLASGDPQWEQLTVDDRLLDLWMDYTADQAATLLAAPAEAVTVLAREASVFPPRPREPKRVAVRRLVKNLSGVKGWPSLVMRLERAWSSEFFEARCDINGYDNRTDEEAEAERAADASDWVAAAEAALTFTGSPFGPSVRTVQDVAEWMMRAYRLTTTVSQVPAELAEAA